MNAQDPERYAPARHVGDRQALLRRSDIFAGQVVLRHDLAVHHVEDGPVEHLAPARLHDGVDQVVDVDRGQGRSAVAEDEQASLESLRHARGQQRGAGADDLSRSQDHRGHAALAHGPEDDPFGLELGLRVHATLVRARLQGPGFGDRVIFADGGRVQYAQRADVHEFRDAVSHDALDDVVGPPDGAALEVTGAAARGRSDVIDERRARHRAVDDHWIGEVAGDDLDALVLHQLAGRPAHEHPHALAIREQALQQASADEAGGAREQDGRGESSRKLCHVATLRLIGFARHAFHPVHDRHGLFRRDGRRLAGSQVLVVRRHQIV